MTSLYTLAVLILQGRRLQLFQAQSRGTKVILSACQAKNTNEKVMLRPFPAPHAQPLLEIYTAEI